MGVTVSFDAPTLIDAVVKAAKIAPTKGAAFDKVAGIFMEIHEDVAIISATNIDSTYRHEVTCRAEIDLPPAGAMGDAAVPVGTLPVVWRVPSTILAGLLSALPMGEGSTVRFADREPGFLKIMSGSTDARLALIRDEPPKIEKFDTSNMSEGNSLPHKLSSVSWAVKRKENGPLGGVRIDGSRLVATDGYRLALIPCEIPIEEPITIDAANFASLLKSASDVRVRADNDRLCVTMDAETQATTRIFMGPYPKYERLFREDFLSIVEVGRADWLEVLQRMLVVIGDEQYPQLDISLSPLGSNLEMNMSTPNGDKIKDSVACSGTFGGEFDFGVLPSNIVQALQATSAGLVTFCFGNSTNPALSSKSTCEIRDAQGFRAIIASKVRTGQQ